MGDSKIIVVANQKGGCGKSTLCMLLANFLVKQHKLPFGGVIDADFQKSIVKKRDEDKIRIAGTKSNEKLGPLYQVASYQLTSKANISEFIKQLKSTDKTFIIDTPGSLTTPGLLNLLSLCDVIITPYDYDNLTLTSTFQFLDRLNDIKKLVKNDTDFDLNIQIILVPCRKPKKGGTKDELKNWEEIRDGLKNIYSVTTEIPQSMDIKLRVDTLELSKEHLKIAGTTLQEIFELIYNPHKEDVEDADE